MPENPLLIQGSKRKPRWYVVEERLVGTATYAVKARNQREAMAKVREGKGGEMVDSGVDHTGTGRARVAEDQAGWEGWPEDDA